MNLGSLTPLLNGIRDALPILSTLGVPGAGIVSAGLKLAESLKEKIDEGHVIASADEAADLKDLITKLEAEADALNARIQAS